MDNFFDVNELMDLAVAYVRPVIDAIYRRLMDQNFALEDPELFMLMTALTDIFRHKNRWDCPTEVLLMVTYGKQWLLDRSNMTV